MTVNFGFHRRSSVLGVHAPATLHGSAGVYDADRIAQRAAIKGGDASVVINETFTCRAQADDSWACRWNRR